VYYDDATFTTDGHGYRRWLCSPAEGALDWDAITAVVRASRPDAAFWVDLHKGQFAIEPFDAAWLAVQPDLEPGEYAAVLALAVRADASWDAVHRDRLAAAQTSPRERLPAAIDGLTALFAS
jgi:hypothetical protein